MKNLHESLLEPSSPSRRQDKASTGGHTIGALGSFMLCMNSLVGPGLVQLPRVVQRAGWLPVTCALSFVSVVSALTVTLFCDVLARMPSAAHPGDDEPRYEYSDLFGHVFGRRSFAFTQLCARPRRALPPSPPRVSRLTPPRARGRAGSSSSRTCLRRSRRWSRRRR